jgi:hypothetical protein
MSVAFGIFISQKDIEAVAMDLIEVIRLGNQRIEIEPKERASTQHDHPSLPPVYPGGQFICLPPRRWR